MCIIVRNIFLLAGIVSIPAKMLTLSYGHLCQTEDDCFYVRDLYYYRKSSVRLSVCPSVTMYSSVARKFFREGEQTQRVFPSFPFPSPFPPLRPLRNRTPKIQLGIWESAVSSPSGVWGGAPSEIEFGAL